MHFYYKKVRWGRKRRLTRRAALWPDCLSKRQADYKKWKLTRVWVVFGDVRMRLRRPITHYFSRKKWQLFVLASCFPKLSFQGCNCFLGTFHHLYYACELARRPSSTNVRASQDEVEEEPQAERRKFSCKNMLLCANVKALWSLHFRWRRMWVTAKKKIKE